MASTKIFVGNLPFRSTTKELLEYFAEFGEIIEVMLIPDPRKAGSTKGYGFITFADPEAVERAISGANQRIFQGRKLIVDRAKADTKKVPGAKSGVIYQKNHIE